MQLRRLFLCGASAATLIVASSALAQTPLPAIEIGKSKQTKYAGKSKVASKARPSAPSSRASSGAGGGGAVAGAGAGLGSGGGEGSGAGSAGGYGGAGPQQSPFNTSYAYENATTATKTDTPVMETPANVQSVTQQVLKDQQITDLSRALQFVSGVTTALGPTDNGIPYGQIVIRGFAAKYIYRDGFRLDLGSAAGFSLGASGAIQFANVQSIEVLKGAAAVLYGLSEPGGIVNIVTKQPLDRPFYAVDQQIGSLAEYRTTLDATGPLTSDKSWLYRVNMSYENNGAPFGYFADNTHAENIFVAPVVKWNVDNDTWVKLEGQYYKNTQSGTFATNPEFNGAFLSIPRSLNYSSAWSPSVNDNIFAALTWLHNFDKDWSIKQMIYFNRYENNTVLRNGSALDNFGFPFAPDPYGFPGPFTSPVYNRSLGSNIYATQTLATETDITGHINTWGAEHALLFGGDFYKTLNWSYYYGSPINSPQSLLYPVNPGLPFLGPLIPSYEYTAPQDTGGLYAQDQIKLPYDLFFMAAARYQYFRQGGGFGGGPSFETNVSGLTASPSHASELQYLTPRFGLLWRPFPWVSGYVSYAEGFSTNTGIIYPNNPAPPTGARDAEAGLKFEFFDGKLRATVDYYDLTQTNVLEPDTNLAHNCGGGPGSCSIVVGEARSKGPELDVQGQIYPGLNLILAYTNQSTAVTKVAPGQLTASTGSQASLLGQPFPGVPRNVATLSGTYEIQDGTLKGLKFGATYRYNGAARVVDGTYLNLGWLTPSVAGYGIVDLLADYPFTYDGWKLDAGVNIHNLLDRTYYTGANYVAPLVGLAGTYGGRSYGDSFSVLGHIGAQWPGSPPAPSKTPSPVLTWVHDWTGPYAGLQIGMGWGENGGDFSFVTPDGFAGTQSFITNGYGVLAGAHLGYNQQLDHFVLGLEGSLDITDLNKSEPVGWSSVNPNSLCPFTTGCGGSIDASISSYFQGSLRARAGYAWNRLLVYGTGGLAFGAFNVLSNAGGLDQFGNFYYAAEQGRSPWLLGWTGGAGVEYAITPRWSARAEWRYSDFGHIAEAPTSFSTTVGGPIYYQGDRHVTEQQVQIGASYKFGGVDPEMFPIVPPIASPIVKGPALAGDLPSLKGGPLPPSVSYRANWTGFYLGGQAGYGWGDNHAAYNFGTPDLIGSGALSHDAQGVIFGAHAGYNQQFDNDLVLGLEASVDGATLIRRETVGSSDLNNDQATLTSMVQSDIQGAVRARAGYAFGRLLPFVAGGLAIGHFGTQSDLASSNNALGFYDGFATHGLQWTTRLGWTFGGGVEWAINNHWSIRGEYRYADFGKVDDAPSVALGSVYSGSRHLDQSQVQFGFSYKFGDPLLAPVALPAVIAQTKAPPIDWTGYSWTGLYAGGQLGMSWGANHGDYYVTTPGGLSAYDPLNGDAQIATVEGHVGYNKQFDHLVLGLEGSVDGGNKLRNSLLPVYDPSGATPGGTLTTALQSTIEGSVRGRVGYAFGRLLPFISGGVALGDFSLHSYLSGGDALGVFNAADAGQSMLRVGWSLGAGVEWAFTRNLALRGEYRYTDYGAIADASTYVGPAGTYFVGTRRLDQNQVLFGVSYKFTDEGQAPIVVANAGDLPHLKGAPAYAPPPSSSPWRGFYAGVNLGGVWDAKSGWTGTSAYYDPSLPFGATVGSVPNLLYLPNGAATRDAGGALGGGQFGYNFQFGNAFVVGAEADVAATGVSGGNRQNGAAYPSPFTPGGVVVPVAPLNAAQASLPYVGTLRGRAGYLVTPTLLLHATAGFAYDGVNAWGVANTRTGWAAGAGAEWMFAPNWSAKVEYLYADLSGGDVSGGWSWNYGASFHPQINILRGGVNYHFDWIAPEAIVAKY